MEATVILDGIPFRVVYEFGRQMACDPLCPNCKRQLQRQGEPLDAMLICRTPRQGCRNPVKAFTSEDEMNVFLNTAASEADKRFAKKD